jgi:glycosyltransferase involved in cell wall biosynthesis
MRFILGLHLADVIVGVSKSVLAGFQRDLVPAGRLKVIYSGLDRLAGMPQDRQAARAKFVDDPKDVVIAVVAALVDVKRVDIAIEAVRLLPSDLISQTRLLIIGDGLDRATLEKRAEGLRVTFTGHRNDVHELLLNVVDILVLPSESEAFGIVLLEAAAAGLPRVGSNIGGIREAIVDDVDGILVPVHDPGALAAAMARLVRDPELRVRYGRAAQQRLRAEFTVGRFLEAFTALYDQMCSTPNPGRISKLLDVLRSVRHQLGGRQKRHRAKIQEPMRETLSGGLVVNSDRSQADHERATA